MFCSKCGSKNDSDSLFCNKCGLKLEKNNSDKNNTNVRSEEKNNRQIVYKSGIQKCPNCGQNLKSFEAICPSCGSEIRGSKSSNTFDDFIQELQSIDANKVINKGMGKQLIESLGFGTTIDVDQQKINLIRNYNVPSNTEDLFEFLIFASSNINGELAMVDYSDLDSVTEELSPAKAINDTWMEKAKQVYQKLKITSKQHPKFSSVEEVYLEKINAIKVNEINKKKGELRSSYISFAILALIVFILFIYDPYIIKFTEPKLVVPFSSAEYIGRNYEDVILELEDIGFDNLVVNEIEMSATDSSKIHGNIVQISFHGVTSFEPETKFRSGTEIEITYYVIKHAINVRVEFNHNLLFNKYDVKMMINGAYKGTIKHGISLDFTFRIRDGNNVITFAKTDDSDVKGSVNITVDGDLNVTYRITALKNEVTIETVISQTFTFIPYQSIKMNSKNSNIFLSKELLYEYLA